MSYVRHNPNANRWTDEARSKVKTLWMAGKSAGEIAGLMSVSRNSVIGIVHRAGLQRDAAAKPEKARKITPPPKLRAPKPVTACKPSRQPKTEAQDRADGLRAPPVKRAVKGGRVGFNFRDAGSAAPPLKNADGEPIKIGEPWVPLSRYDRAFKPLEGTEPRPFLDRRAGQCRWPIDGADGEFLACCAPSGVKNYCETHHALGHTASIRKASGEDLVRAFRKVA